MIDNIPMPDGLTTKDIPISTKISDLADMNKSTMDLLSDSAHKQQLTNSIQTRLLTNIYTKLNDEISVTFDDDEETKDFHSSTTTSLNKITHGINTLISNSVFQLQNLPSEQESIMPNDYYDAVITQLDMINKNVATIVEGTSFIPPMVTEQEDTKQEEQDKKQDERQSKFFTNLQEQFGKMTQAIGGATSNLYDNVMPTFLGQWNILTQPLKELTGIDLLALPKKMLSGIFGKKSSKNPSKEDVAKGGFLGAGFLYLGNMMSKLMGKGEDGLDGKLGGLGGLLNTAGIVSSFTKGLGVVGLAGFIGMKIKDAIEGSKMAEEWGVSQTEAIIGAILGGTGEGLDNAIKNGLVTALGGAGIGLMVAGPLGAIVGGVVGLIMGGISGFFGGEWFANKISEATDILERNARIKAGEATNLDIYESMQAQLEKERAKFDSISETVETNRGKARANALEDLKEQSQTITDLQSRMQSVKEQAVVNPEGLSTYQAEKRGFFDSVGAWFKGDASFSSKSVNDAIITKDGQIIHTHEDDNIIATKNDPTSIMQFPQSESVKPIVTLPDINNNNVVNTDNSKVVSLLQSLLDTLIEKDMKPVVVTANQSDGNLEAVRRLGVNR